MNPSDQTPEEFRAAVKKHNDEIDAFLKTRKVPQMTAAPSSDAAVERAMELIREREERIGEELLIEKAERTEPTINRDPLRTTDMGNAERFAEQHHRRAKFCNGYWYTWDGRRWKKDDTEAVRRLARATVKSLYREVSELENDKDRERMAKHAKQSESSKAISAMLREAQAENSIVLSGDRLDAPKTRYLFNFENGTLDIRSGELKAHDPQDLITRISPVRFDIGATHGLFNDFLHTVIPDGEVRAFLQRYIGSALTGDTSDQQFVILHGSGANGKSTFVSVILSMMGDYGKQANFETFLANEKKGGQGGARPDLVSLRGARFVAAVEAGSGRRLDETTIKALTGGDLIAARELYKNEESFQPECKVSLVANTKPEIWGNDHAIWRRVLDVPFHVTIPEDQRDPSIRERLCHPDVLSAVAAWAALGALEWYENTTNRLRPPPDVLAATREYQDEEDALAPFLDARCTLSENARVASSIIWKEYLNYCESEKAHPVGRRTFTRLLSGSGFKPARFNDGKTRSWVGVGLNSTIL